MHIIFRALFFIFFTGLYRCELLSVLMNIEYKHAYHDLASVTEAIENGQIKEVVFIGENEDGVFR